MESQKTPAMVLQVFSHERFGQIRVIVIDGEPQFCLSDVCQVLDLTVKGVVQRIEKEVISNYPLETAGGIQKMYFVNEDGLYDVIFDSRKSEAKCFRKWITKEVLPALRKHGCYTLPFRNEHEYPYLDDAVVASFLQMMETCSKYNDLCHDLQETEEKINESQAEWLRLTQKRDDIRNELKATATKVDSSIKEFFGSSKRISGTIN